MRLLCSITALAPLHGSLLNNLKFNVLLSTFRRVFYFHSWFCTRILVCALCSLSRQWKQIGIFTKLRLFIEEKKKKCLLRSDCHLVPFSMHAQTLSRVGCSLKILICWRPHQVNIFFFQLFNYICVLHPMKNISAL